MNLFALLVLIGWMPFVALIFTMMPPRKAVANLFVAAWLFLPNSGLSIPGMPDYTKMTATVIGVMLCAVIFNQGILFSIRPRWFDIPMVVWCFGPFFSALSNGLPAYEGASAVLGEVVGWGLPYIVGRVYLDSVDALKDFAQAMVVGALCYIPLCLIEIRLSPVLGAWIYGINRWEGTRYGGFRPRVFLNHGLELGMWMSDATLMSFSLWYSGAIRAIRGISMGKVSLALLATAILCKSTGALSLLVFGMLVLWATKQSRWRTAIWLMLAIAPFYCLTRTLGIWSGREVVEISKATVGEDRAQSFEYRLNMEEILIKHAVDRPVWGWGRFGRNMVAAENGKILTVPDGYWIIALGVAGIVGLTALVAMFTLPLVLTLRRFPVETWRDPQVAPVVCIALMLALTMIDFLSNAMVNPIYPLLIGGILGQSPHRPGTGHGEAEEALAVAAEFVGEGRAVEAGREFRRAIELASEGADAEALRIKAEAFDGLGHSLLASGQPEESAAAFREALAIRDELAADSPDPDRFRDLAIARDGLSRALAESGRTAEAIEERQIALQTWEILAANHPKDVEYREHLANTLNDLAWLLSTDPARSRHDPALALALAEEAVRVSSDRDASWNTLGVARYRAGDWAGAIEALERSALSGPGGKGTAFDHYFLAMAWCRLGRLDQTGEWLDRGKAWVARHRPGHPALERFREEAESLSRGDHAIDDLR